MFGFAVKSLFVNFPFSIFTISAPCQASDVKL